MAVQPTFTAVFGLNGNYRTIAVFIDKVPPFVEDKFAKKRPSPGEALQPTEQLQELVEITSVEQAGNAPLVILKAKYLGRRTMSFSK